MPKPSAKSPVHLTARAQKDLSRIVPKQRLRILSILKQLGSPSSLTGKEIKRIEGIGQHELYRLRIGAYRVLFVRGPEAVTVLRVVSRQDLEKVIRQLTGVGRATRPPARQG